jgi:acetyltransferase-like isoleucine patch superfamily enzyme|tara:strand:+ start:739 stop:1458 length:720 start_codon:yes stop_codon:yes gene_type:complete
LQKDNRPFYVRLLVEKLYSLWAKLFIIPQFQSVGKNLDINKPWNIDVYGNKISLGNNVHLRTSKNIITQLCAWNRNGCDGEISIGDNVLISPGVKILSSKKITIESNVMIASNVYISDSDWHDTYDRILTPGISLEIHISENAWIGEGSKITKGVKIGKNSIVGLGSIVTSDIPDNSIFGGNPAKKIGEIDINKLTRTREDLFLNKDYKNLMRFLIKEDLKDNNIFKWLRTIFYRKKGD